MLDRPPTTGDVVLFDGNSIPSRIIQWRTGSRWSHVGIVVHRLAVDAMLRRIYGEHGPAIKRYDPLECYILESTKLCGVPDVIRNRRVDGVQVTGWTERTAGADSEICLRRLSLNGVQLSHGRVGYEAAKYYGRSYERSLWRLIGAAIDWVDFVVRGDPRSLFCSELVARVLQGVGLLSRAMDAEEATPGDFGDNGEYLSDVVDGGRLINCALMPLESVNY